VTCFLAGFGVTFLLVSPRLFQSPSSLPVSVESPDSPQSLQRTLELLRESSGAQPEPKLCTFGAKRMDPPVLPRLLNSIKFSISEESIETTLGLLADTPNARVRNLRCSCMLPCTGGCDAGGGACSGQTPASSRCVHHHSLCAGL